MKKFVIRSFLFSVILSIIIILPSIYLYQTKEYLVSVDTLIKTNNSIIGYKYNRENIREYKLKKINSNKRLDLMALGSSRVLQFRKEMFKESFYNAGFLIESISDFKIFLSCISKEKYPKTLIIGLDQWMFNENWDNLKVKKEKTFWTNSYTFYPPVNIIIKNLLQKNFFYNYKSDDLNKIGIKAINNNSGFRNDGSRSYGKQISLLLNEDETLEDFEYRDTFKRIEDGNKRFEYSNTVYVEAISELNTFLKFCNSNNIEVIAFIPPFAKGVIEKMNATNKYHYIDSIYNKIEPIFNNYNFEIYDYTNPITLKSLDNEFIDGFHGGELTYLKIIKNMISKKSKIDSFVNFKNIEKSIVNKSNRYVVY